VLSVYNHLIVSTMCRIASKFFSLGQVIETVRGGGVFQPAIDDAIRKLDQGEWVSAVSSISIRAPAAQYYHSTWFDSTDTHFPGRQSESAKSASTRRNETIQMGNVSPPACQ
jgi:hypothetical protein